MHDRNFPNELPVTRRARLAVNKLNDLQHEMHLLTTEIEVAKRNLKNSLRDMAEAGAPPEPWAEHWSRALATSNN